MEQLNPQPFPMRPPMGMPPGMGGPNTGMMPPPFGPNTFPNMRPGVGAYTSEQD